MATHRLCARLDFRLMTRSARVRGVAMTSLACIRCRIELFLAAGLISD